MNEFSYAGLESMRIVRADGNLRVMRSNSDTPAIASNTEPDIRREGANAELTLRGNAEIRIGPGLMLEIVHCRGNLDLEDVTTPLTLGRLDGNLRARRIGALNIQERVAGNATIETGASFSCDRIAGSLRIDHAPGAIRVRQIAGKLEAESVGMVEVDSVAGKAVARGVSGGIRISRVGGRLRLEDIGGDVAVEQVGDHLTVSSVAGNLGVYQVGGAAELRGPMPAGKLWRISCGGRAALELDADASIDLLAHAGWGRIVVSGLDESKLERGGWHRAAGTLGVERPDAERTRVEIETRHADIVIARAGEREYGYCAGGFARRSRRFPGAFDELGEILGEEFGHQIPRFVHSVLGAAGHFMGSGQWRNGRWGSEAMRATAEEAARGVREGLAGLGRAFQEAGTQAGGAAASAAEDYGRKLGDQIRRAAEQGYGRTREERREMRESIRRAAEDLREALLAAKRAARKAAWEFGDGSYRNPRSADQASKGASNPCDAKSDIPREESTESSGVAPNPATAATTRPFSPESHERDMMQVLNQLSSGEIEIDEADAILAALMEVEQTARDA